MTWQGDLAAAFACGVSVDMTGVCTIMAVLWGKAWQEGMEHYRHKQLYTQFTLMTYSCG